MTTLSDMVLDVMKEVMEVIEGVCDDAGTISTLKDSNRTEKNGTFNKGTIFILSGDNAGVMLEVKGFMDQTITVDAQSSAFASGDRYAIANADYPLWKVKQSINTVLGDVLGVDESLSYVANDYQYTLPTLSGQVVGVELVDDLGESAERAVPSAHWKVRRGELIFDYGFGGKDGDTIRLLVKGAHDELVDGDDEINAALNDKKILWDAAVDVLQWGYRKYKDQPGKRVEDYLQMALAKQEKFGRAQNDELPRVRYKSAGWRRCR